MFTFFLLLTIVIYRYRQKIKEYLAWNLILSLARFFFLIKNLQNLKNSPGKEKTSFQILPGKKAAKIIYVYQEKEYSLYIPYNPNGKSYIVKLEKEKEKIDISQQRGIPYFISAEMLGGKRIIFTDPREDDNDEVIYTKDKIPSLS